MTMGMSSALYLSRYALKSLPVHARLAILLLLLEQDLVQMRHWYQSN